MEKCFDRAVALWKDQIHNEKHKEIPGSGDSFFGEKSKGFSGGTFLLELFNFLNVFFI